MPNLKNLFKRDKSQVPQEDITLGNDARIAKYQSYLQSNGIQSTFIGNDSPENVSKGFNGKVKSHDEPTIASLGYYNVNPDYKTKGKTTGMANLHGVLKSYSSNIILNAIINTRANQVSMFGRPARYSEKGQGYRVRLKDISSKPNARNKKEMKEIEAFLENTVATSSSNRSSFVEFLKKVVRDTYIYDQVNFEKVFSEKNGTLQFFELVDPSTIFIGTEEKEKLANSNTAYLQVINSQITARYSQKEMAFAVRNPRTDIYSGGYGQSELEIGLPLFNAYTNLLAFNDRFFTHGGTTRGVLNIKPMGANQSQTMLEAFRREWQNSVTGTNASWQIPVVSAEDVKFINMTPSANDMQFEKWSNTIINNITSLYSIDPTEINFPNNAGVSGSSGAISGGSTARKTQDSQKKGLLPLLLWIEDVINKNIISEFGDEYTFQFVGGDISEQLERINILSEKTKFAMTLNEAREELGLQGDVLGGDIPLNGVAVQRIGQLLQQEQFEYKKQQDRLELLMANTAGSIPVAQPTQPTEPTPPTDPEPTKENKPTGENTDDANNFQEQQRGLAGNSSKVNGKGTVGEVGKDGQIKGEGNTNSYTTSLDPNHND